MESNSLIFIQLAVVLVLASLAGYVVRVFRLPLVVAYLLAGVVLSLLRIFDVTHSLALTFLPEIGVAFVLFFVGMELDLKEVKSLGKAITISSLVQIIISVMAGFLIASALGFSSTESFYLGVGLSFSSTIVVIKLLLEKKDLGSLYGKLSIGILLIEDLVAILLLMVMTVSSSALHLGLQNNLPLLALLAKGILLLILTLALSVYVLPKLFAVAAKSAELLFLSALAWCFAFVALSQFLGFSVVIGAFLAGVALANSPFHFEIQGKVKPLRDFFVTLFFVYLGSQVAFENLTSVLPLIIVFTLYALFIKPILFLLILGGFGFRKHTIFQTAINLSQVSEFSLILMVVGLKLGTVSAAALTAMALTGVISIIFSSIMIAFSRKIYSRLIWAVGFFEHGHFIHQAENKENLDLEDHVILIGSHRIGGEVVRFLKREKIPYLIVDFNPRIIARLMEEKVPALYGDAGDPEILDFLNLEKAKLLVSTAPDLEDNLTLLSEVKRRKVRAVVIARASSAVDTKTLYDAGADFVIVPEIVSGDYISQMLQNHWPNMDFFKGRPQIELNKLARSHLAFE